MTKSDSSVFAMGISRRTVLKIAGGGALAITFFPRIAFAARNNLIAIRTGTQPGEKTRFVIETSARPSYSVSYPTAEDGRIQIMVELSNTAGDSSVKPVYAANTLVKSIDQNQSGDRLQIIANLRKRIHNTPKPSSMILDPNGDAQYRLVLDFAMGPGDGKGAGSAAATTTAAAPKKTRKPIIVIDAGHGGKDPGAIGKSGIKEKVVVLAVAKKLRVKLSEAGFDAQLTRSTDIFLNLDTRAGMAEQKRADLFLSLHANANPSREMRGFSVYTLSKRASDEEAQKLADAENAADKIEIDGFAKFEPDIRNALSALQQHAVAELSVEFADMVQKRFKGAGIPAQPNGALRSAPFAVLRSTIPSALLELGHLSHKEEEKLLNTDAHQDKLVAAIVRAIKDYDFDS